MDLVSNRESMEYVRQKYKLDFRAEEKKLIPKAEFVEIMEDAQKKLEERSV